MSSPKLRQFLSRFKMDVVAETATLTGVMLYKIKDEKVIFIDAFGSKFAIPINTIIKIMINRVP